MLQRDRKVVLSDWYTDEYIQGIDEVFHDMALKGIVHVVAASDSFTNLDINTWSPMVTSNPDDGMSALRNYELVWFHGIGCDSVRSSQTSLR